MNVHRVLGPWRTRKQLWVDLGESFVSLWPASKIFGAKAHANVLKCPFSADCKSMLHKNWPNKYEWLARKHVGTYGDTRSPYAEVEPITGLSWYVVSSYHACSSRAVMVEGLFVELSRFFFFSRNFLVFPHFPFFFPKYWIAKRSKYFALC